MKTITPTPEEMEQRIARFASLEVLPAIRDLDMPLAVKDVIYSRKLLPAIAPEAGDTPIAAGATIRGAAGVGPEYLEAFKAKGIAFDAGE